MDPRITRTGNRRKRWGSTLECDAFSLTVQSVLTSSHISIQLEEYYEARKAIYACFAGLFCR